MTVADLAHFLDGLKQLGSAERALQDARYHKSTRIHWGVPAPIAEKYMKEAVKGLAQSELHIFAKALWETNLFDPMMCAAKVLCMPRVKPSRALWDLLLDFLTKVDGWALEDGLAHVAWKCIRADLTLLDQVEQWTTHGDFWMRRAALVYTLPFAKKGECPERMLGWASLYAGESQWFIQKAIGWWLRILGAHNPERVHAFLLAHWDTLKGVARKEATRKLDSVWQEKIFSRTRTSGS